MLVVSSNEHLAHDGVEIYDGELIRSFESPERAELIATALRAAGHDFILPVAIEKNLLERIHAPDYLEFLESAWKRWAARGTDVKAAMGFVWPCRGLSTKKPDDIVGQLGYYSFAADTSLVAGTWPAALAAASIAMTAADQVIDHGASVYGLCRPPGHHASVNQFGGYCYINNAAIAAQRLLDRGARRVAILDLDYHHGNGTQSIFYTRSDVLFVSIHADPMQEFPWFAGHADEKGQGDGGGWNVNLPLPRGSSVSAWLAALEMAVQRIEAANVDGLVISLGVDAYENDPIGTFALTTENFSGAADCLKKLELPMVIVQEGGYAVEQIGNNVAAFLEPL